MALAAGTYRGRLGGQVYQAEAYEPQGLNGAVYESLRGLGSTKVTRGGSQRVRFTPSEFWKLVAAAGKRPEDFNNKTESDGRYIYTSTYVADYLYGLVAPKIRALQLAQRMSMRGVVTDSLRTAATMLDVAKQQGLYGVYADSGMTTGSNEPMRVAMLGRTKVMYSLRQEGNQQALDTVLYGQAQTHESFQTRQPAAGLKVALGAVGLGGIAGALLATVLL